MPQGPDPYKWEENREYNYDKYEQLESVTENRNGIWKIKEITRQGSGSRKNISDFKPLFTNLAQTSHFEVQFGGLSDKLESYLVRKNNISRNFIQYDVGLLCNSASLPTTSFATAVVDGNFTGISEKFAHTRQYQQIVLDFYVDKNYKSLLFLESWMEFIASGSYTNSNIWFQNEQNYFSRMQYPDDYKSNSTKIIKFDRDYRREINYTFVGLFPISLVPIQVSYQDSQILKVSASFEFDRYIAGKTTSLDEILGFSNNQGDNGTR
jgi:hypothetical protein